MAQKRRTAGKVGATATFAEDMKVTMKKDHFLANAKNKQLFIRMLSQYLQKIGCETRHAQGDADVLIVKTAVESATTRSTVLVGDDTDLLVLLLYYTCVVDGCDIYFRPEPKANSRKRRVWNIKKVKEQWGVDVCDNILFIHAILGCDTTSRLHGIGKGVALKKFISSPYFRQQAQVFNVSSNPDAIASAGENALVCLYNSKPGGSLNALRYQKYYEKITSKSSQIQPQSLPPTSSAAKYHSFRVYHQIRQWKGEDVPVDGWGWSSRGDDLVVPVMMDLPPAPESLLHVIRCNCSSDCSTRRCTCHKNNLECSTACGQCKGSACTNCTIDDDNDEFICLIFERQLTRKHNTLTQYFNSKLTGTCKVLRHLLLAIKYNSKQTMNKTGY